MTKIKATKTLTKISLPTILKINTIAKRPSFIG
jgi:hypothetical protein